MDEQQKELLELCREVYKRTEWKNTTKSFYIPVDFKSTDIWVRNEYNYDDSKMLWHCPLYTSDYILEKLPIFTELYKDSNGVEYRASINNHANTRCYSDTPLKALLKLVLVLHDAGMLES